MQALFTAAVFVVLLSTSNAQIPPPAVSSSFVSPTTISNVQWSIATDSVQSVATYLVQNADLKKTVLVMDIANKAGNLISLTDQSTSPGRNYQWVNNTKQCTVKEDDGEYFPMFQWMSSSNFTGAQVLLGQVVYEFSLTAEDKFTLTAMTAPNTNIPARLLIQSAKDSVTAVYDFDGFNPTTPPAGTFAVPDFCHSSPVKPASFVSEHEDNLPALKIHRKVMNVIGEANKLAATTM